MSKLRRAWLAASVLTLSACAPARPAEPTVPSHQAPPSRTAPPSAQPRPAAAAPSPEEAGPPVPPAPATPSTIVDVESDSVLRALGQSLPRGWRLYGDGTRIVVERAQQVWVLPENRINAPMDTESPAARQARIQKHGRREHARILFRAEERWSDEVLRAARDHNDAVHRLLAGLADRHGIRHLVDADRSRKHRDLRRNATPEELTRIDAYEAEQKELVGQLKELPDFLTERYALFSDGYEGWSDAHHSVGPSGVEEECYRLSDAVRELLASRGTKVEP